jgi:hypothetical protein
MPENNEHKDNQTLNGQFEGKNIMNIMGLRWRKTF